MTRRALLTVLAVAVFSGSPFAQVPVGVIPSAEIQKILAERVDTYRQSVGVVVGVIEPSGRRIITYERQRRTRRGRSTATRSSRSAR